MAIEFLFSLYLWLFLDVCDPEEKPIPLAHEDELEPQLELRLELELELEPLDFDPPPN